MGVLQIRVKRHGPYTIALEDAGAVCIVDHDGNQLIPEPGRPIVLCRCGGSGTKPFCDGTHKRNGFLRPTGWRPEGGEQRVGGGGAAAREAEGRGQGTEGRNELPVEGSAETKVDARRGR